MTGKELAQIHGTTIAMIRYYARVGLIPAVEKRNGKLRQYTVEESDTVELIETLSAAGLSLGEIIEYIAHRTRGTAAGQNQLVILRERRARLIEKANRLGKMVQRMDREIRSCDPE